MGTGNLWAALTVGLAAVLLSIGAAACGSSRASSGNHLGSVTLVMGAFPDSLDPAYAQTTQAAEPDVLAYTGLVTYAHANGVAGTRLIPGLATSLPTVSDGGRTYTFTLRRGLIYSSGRRVRAGDFAWTVERAIKAPWLSSPYLTAEIEGAQAFAHGRARSISGITTNDTTGRITIRLTSPFGAFAYVLALPALGLVPSGTPFKNEPTAPPPGVGPYRITAVVSDQSFLLVRNRRWRSMRIPGIPAGYENVRVEVSSNVTANAESVLRNSADVFDWADAIPGDLKPEIAHVAAGRYSTEVHASTYWFFLNTRSRPFSSRLAREAVIVGLDRPALSRLSGGTLVPACYYVPEGMVGHPTAACPYADPNSHGDLAKARALVKASGMAGTPVTVWGENSSPRRQWTDYYTDLLNRIGFRASERILNSAIYFPTVGDLKLDPQTGFVDWNQEFPDPLDFYLQLESSSILPSNNPNLGQIRDARIDAQVSSLAPVPPAGLAGVARDWQALDEYTARQAYLAVFGYRTFPAFTSNRIDRRALVFHPVYGWDWSSFRLK